MERNTNKETKLVGDNLDTQYNVCCDNTRSYPDPTYVKSKYDNVRNKVLYVNNIGYVVGKDIKDIDDTYIDNIKVAPDLTLKDFYDSDLQLASKDYVDSKVSFDPSTILVDTAGLTLKDFINDPTKQLYSEQQANHDFQEIQDIIAEFTKNIDLYSGVPFQIIRENSSSFDFSLPTIQFYDTSNTPYWGSLGESQWIYNLEIHKFNDGANDRYRLSINVSMNGLYTMNTTYTNIVVRIYGGESTIMKEYLEKIVKEKIYKNAYNVALSEFKVNVKNVNISTATDPRETEAQNFTALNLSTARNFGTNVVDGEYFSYYSKLQNTEKVLCYSVDFSVDAIIEFL